MSQTIDVKRYEELARQKQGEHRKFLAQLNKKAPKNLDKIVQQVHNEVFQEIDCTQCANCCKTLGPDKVGSEHFWVDACLSCQWVSC